jgi:hypothetical protein
MNTLKSLTAMVAFALAIGSAQAIPPGPPDSFILKLVLTQNGWQMEGGLYPGLFPFVAGKNWLEMDSQGYIRMRSAPPEEKVKPGWEWDEDELTSVLPIRLLQTEKGFDVNFFGLQLRGDLQENRTGNPDWHHWKLYHGDTFCGGVTLSYNTIDIIVFKDILTVEQPSHATIERH